MVATGSFTILDYVVVGGTLVITMLIGVYYGILKKQKTNTDLLVGGRDMPIVPTSLSLLATYMSPILVLGYAGEIYSYGTLLCETIFGAIICVPIAAGIFMPVLYPLKLTSAYDYLERRFDSVGVRCFAAITFLLQTTAYMGVVLFAPAIALNAVIGFPNWISIIVLGGCAAVYTSIGGLKAVVWTDVFQMLIMLAGMFAIVIEGSIQKDGLKNVFNIAQQNGRIEFLNFTFDPFRRLSSLNIFFGHAVMVLAICGCQQTTVQRYSSMSSLKKGIMTMIITLPLVVFTVSLAALAGIVIFANYAGCDPLTLGIIKRNDQIAPYFVLQYLSPTSGLLGLFIACLFSASLSTVSSGLNSVAAVTWEDFCFKLSFFKRMSETRQSLVTKVIGLIFGLLTIGMAFLAENFEGVLAASIILNGTVAGPLLGVFLLGIAFTFTNKWGAMVGMACGHVLTIWISIGAGLLRRKSPMLPMSIEECPLEIFESLNATKFDILNMRNMSAVPPELDWPKKIYTVSFLLYPLIGCTITIFVGVIVSLITGPKRLSKDEEKYVHPFVRKLMFRKSSTTMEMKSHSNGTGNGCRKENGYPAVKSFQAYANSGFNDT